MNTLTPAWNKASHHFLILNFRAFISPKRHPAGLVNYWQTDTNAKGHIKEAKSSGPGRACPLLSPSKTETNSANASREARSNSERANVWLLTSLEMTVLGRKWSDGIMWIKNGNLHKVRTAWSLVPIRLLLLGALRQTQLPPRASTRVNQGKTVLHFSPPTSIPHFAHD